MDIILEIKRKLQEITGGGTVLITGEVMALQKETCSLRLASGLKLTDVRLKVSYNKAENFAVFYPKIGSRVLCISLNGSLSDLAVIKIDELEKMEIKQGGFSFVIDSSDGKIQIKNAETSLLDLLQNLTDILKTLQVYTGTGPSGFPIQTVQNRLNTFETEFKKLLK